MIGSVGQAIMFVFGLAGLSLVTPFVFLSAAHLYVTVLISSSTGEERFRWPRESFYEWFGEGFVVVAALSVCAGVALVPVGVLAATLPLEWALGIGAFVLVAITPICLCSMMSAPSKLMLIHPPLLGRLLMHAKGLAYVYFVTTPLLVVAGWGLWIVVDRHDWVGVFVVAIALPLGLILHARAWGRLSWLAMNFDRKRRRKKKQTKEPEVDAIAVDLEPLDVDEEDRYGVNAEFTSTAEEQVRLEAIYAEQRASEKRDRLRAGTANSDDVDPPTFQTALGQGIFSFVFDVDNLLTCLGLGIGCVVEMGLLMLLVAF